MRAPGLSDNTIVALSTPPGRSAIGVIRVSGPRARQIVGPLWRGRTMIDQAQAGRHYYGHIEDGAGEVIDQAVLSLWVGPASYTGYDVIELSCHGAPIVLEAVVRAIIEHGARYAGPGEFTRQAFLNGRLDLTQAEAVADLIDAESPRARQAALAQLSGQVSGRLKELREQLLEATALIELELDFSEEDVEFARRDQLESLLVSLDRELAGLIESFTTGRAVREGVVVVLAGAPNVGKSTLLNALLGHDRAIVSEIPGTTRDTIEDRLELGGWQVRLVDTAGLRETSDPIEKMGIDRTRQMISQAAIILALTEGTHPEAPLPVELEKITSPPTEVPTTHGTVTDPPVVISVRTKGDLTPPDQPVPEGTIEISARTGAGMDLLRTLIMAELERRFPAPPSGLITNARHHGCLLAARSSLEDALRALQDGLPTDLIAQDLRHTLHPLAEITGHISPDHVLGYIFGRFCIGK